MSRLLMLAVCGLMLASCNNNANNVILASLERSGELQLLCADITDLPTSNAVAVGKLLPLDLCVEGTDFSSELEPNILGAVTQTQTGTVAAMSFTRSFILDTNITVPGVTALVVGEQPTGIQISPVEPSYTYISSFSPKSVQAIPTISVLTGETDVFVQEPIRFDVGPADIALHESAFSEATFDDETGEVTGAISTVNYRFLYVALPESGQIAQIKVAFSKDEDGSDRHVLMGPPTFISLGTYDCDTVTLVDPPESTATDYKRICPEYLPERDEGRVVKTVRTTKTCVDGPGDGPSPVALNIDLGLEQTGVADLDDVLLVADSNQPVIHRFRINQNGAREIEPIITGTPTLDVDVTPYVPATSESGDLAATQRYVYAISAADSSVFAVDYSLSSTETQGAVIPVLAGVSARANEENVESRNRVRFAFSNVRAIEVVSPDYAFEENPDGSVSVQADSICDPNDGNAFGLAQNESNMRGVFLAVSLSNGTMFFLDIYDLNAPCRGGEGAIACTVAETGPDRYASIRRHRRRVGLTPTTFIQIEGTPSLQFNTAPGQISELNGEASNSDGADLQFIQCPESMGNMFGVPPSGSDTDGLICGSTQIWSNATQRWEALWGGLIPNSEGGLGLFADESFQGEPGDWFLAGDVPFCRVGVLGAQGDLDIDPGTDLSIERLDTYVGDRLVIVGDLPPNTRDDPACEDFLDLRENLDDFQIWFPILEAYEDQLKIGDSADPRKTLAKVRACFGEFTEYQIHTQDAYTVTGTQTGFIHRIVPDPSNDGECVFDDSREVMLDDVDTFLTGRAFPDSQFINPLVSFEIGPYPPTTSITDATVSLLNFNISNQFGSLNIDTSTAARSLPSSMLFSPSLEQLFFVDFEAGVRRLLFSPLNIVQTFD